MDFHKVPLFLVVLVLLFSVSTRTSSVNTDSLVTLSSADDYEPSLARNGSRIAFISNLTTGPELFVVDSHGANLRQLTANRARECCPSVSGDGSKTVFQSDTRGDEEVFVINSDGTIPSSCVLVVPGTGCQLTNNRDDDVSPVISSDGSKIAFVSNRDGDPEVFVMNSDGTGVRQLTLNLATDEYPSISGDGTVIAFDSNIGVDYEIFTIRSNGTGLKQVTNNSSNDDRFASISLDGSKVAFVSTGPLIASSRPISSYGLTPPVLSPGGSSVVMISKTDGTGLKVLTPNSGANFDASLSGDGTVVAFISTVNGDRDVYNVHSDGSGLTQITNDPGFDMQPRLDLDGNLLVYVSNASGNFDIHVTCHIEGDVNADGSVNFIDLGRVGSAFGTSFGSPGYDSAADLNKDGSVNFLDLGIVGANFMKSCNP